MTVLATMKGKEYAVEQLLLRCAQNKNRKSVDDSSLPAGSPMHYDCKGCNAEIVVPESHPFKETHCEECKAMSQLGWLE